MPPESRGDKPNTMEATAPKKTKLGAVSGVYIPVVLNIISILMFLRFGSILGRVGLFGILGLLVVAYLVDFLTTLSLSAIASNGEVKGGGAYYLISRSLGPEFGGSIGVLFYLSQVLNTALNVVGLIDCLKLNLKDAVPYGYWEGYLMETCALVFCTTLCLAGSGIFARASNALLVILIIATLSIPVSALLKTPFKDSHTGVDFTGLSSKTLLSNLYPHTSGPHYKGLETFRELFGILFPATSGIFAGASMSGDLKNPSKAIPKGTLWAMLSTLTLYLLVILSLASSITHGSFLRHTNVLSTTSLWSPLILAGECATTVFSVLMGIIGSAKLLQALARDKLLPGISTFGHGTKRGDEPVYAILITFVLAQLALFADLNQIATLISMGYQMTFFVMNLACFFLKIGSAPNFRPAFKFFNWQTAFVGSVLSAACMFFIDGTYAALAICLMISLFLLIHYLSPPRHWGDVSQNLIYHQVRKYLLRLKPEHIKFWRPQIILLINDPRRHTRLIQFCNSMKKGSLYILGHVIVTDDFNTGIHEAKLQQSAWTRYITEFSRIKAFVQLTMSPTIEWGVRNLILSAGLGGMRPNIAVLGFYNMDELRREQPRGKVPDVPQSPNKPKGPTVGDSKAPRRRRGDTSARLLEGFLPTDAIRTESMLSATSYLTILEDLALRHRLNVAIGKGFQNLETPRTNGGNSKKYIDLWPIQMSAEISAEGKSVVTTNFDTYTLILQLGYILLSVPTWKKAFTLRILVFVEYESEVVEEEARLNALLDKLRIEAEVTVFWLACGRIGSYESIVNGKTTSDENDQVIEQLLKGDEWWDEVQRIRKEASQMSRSQEGFSLGEMLDPIRRRGSSNARVPDDDDESSRRLSSQDIVDLPKKSTVSRIYKLGGNFGIHTHNLGRNTFENRPERLYYDDTDETDDEDDNGSNADFNDGASVVSEGDVDDTVSLHHSLLRQDRRKSHGDLLMRPDPSKKADRARNSRATLDNGTSTPGYGTMDSKRPQSWDKRPSATPADPIKRSESANLLLRPLAEGQWKGGESSTSTPPPVTRPAFSRQSSASRFSSRPTPETTVADTDGAGPTIAFKQPENSSSPELRRPPISRNSSMGRFSSRPVPETTVESDGTSGPRLMFAETGLRPSDTPIRSRRNSSSQNDGLPSAQLNIPELLEAYRFRERSQEDVRSNYSAQSVPLSFNDLPNRAQHLILNELMRQNTSETAVLLTTLPIPEEGTCQSAEASIRYLSDIEVLCHELPPVLLVLSNNMTVTVSL